MAFLFKNSQCAEMGKYTVFIISGNYIFVQHAKHYMILAQNYMGLT